MGLIADKVATMRGCSLREIVETIAAMEADDPVLDVGETGFHQFWEAYPYKTAKPAARRAYNACRKGTGCHERKFSHAEIMEGLEVYIRTKPRERDWCMPSTFLNQERFCDTKAMTEQSRSVKSPADLFGNMSEFFDARARESEADAAAEAAVRRIGVVQ